MNGDGHTSMILEMINDQLKAIREGQAAMASVPTDIHDIKELLVDVEADIKVIRLLLLTSRRSFMIMPSSCLS